MMRACRPNSLRTLACGAALGALLATSGCHDVIDPPDYNANCDRMPQFTKVVPTPRIECTYNISYWKVDSYGELHQPDGGVIPCYPEGRTLMTMQVRGNFGSVTYYGCDEINSVTVRCP